MDEISKSVAQSIKSGEYYKDARRWYTHKYLYPVTERSFLFLIFLVTSIGFIAVLLNFNALFPLNREVPFIVKVDNSIDYYSVIKPLAPNSEKPQEAITKYLLADYITTYESYNFKDIAFQETRIRANSSKQVFKAFSNLMSTDNPESPLLLYHKTSTKTVKILSITILQDDPGSSKATVTFETTLEDRLRKKKNTSTDTAEITFSISNINDIATSKNPLEFIVTDYHVRPLQ